jgi:ABC-type transport system involved in multi-copper enzyme maturation permease subunit
VLGARWLRDFNFGAPELKFLADCGFGAMAFLGSALTIAATAQLFFSEIENRTALTLLAKPVWRAEFILGKLLGVAALAAVFCALLTALLSFVLAWREAELAALAPEAVTTGGGVSHAMVALGGLMQWLRLLVLAAFTLLVASFAQSQLFSVVTGFLVLVVCHLQHLAQESYARAGSAAGMLLSALISAVFPNFQVFLLVDSLSGADLPAVGDVIRVVLYGAGYAAAAAALAILSFRRREI